MIPPPRINSINYARLVKYMCQKIAGQQQVWVRIPMVTPLNAREREAPEDGWYAWDSFRFKSSSQYLHLLSNFLINFLE